MATGKEITSLGGYPMNVQKVDAKVTMPVGTKKAIVLDGNGYPTDKIAGGTVGALGVETITLPPDSLYTLVE